MDKIALVTGASAGIGWDIASYLNKKGFTVVAAARRLEKMSALQDEGIYTVSLDVSDSDSIDNALADIRENVGEIDILVNNAGVMYMAPAELADLDEIRHLYNVNFFGLIELTQKCLAHMRAQQWGRVLNVTSVGGLVSMPFNSVYQSGKFALEGWSRGLKQEVRKFGIGVSTIRPGSIKSEIYDTTFAAEEDSYDWAGPYKEDFVRVLNQLEAFGNQYGSEPACISELVYEAITSESPRVGYIGPTRIEEILHKDMRTLTEDERDARVAETWGM